MSVTDPVSPQDAGREPPAVVELRVGSDSEWRPCTLVVESGALHLTRGTSSFDLDFNLLNGIAYAEPVLLLYTTGQSTVELRPIDVSSVAQLSLLARHVDEQVRVLRESTRSLRALGARRGHPGADHDRFFEPLLSAKRRAEAQSEPGARLSQFDAARIAAEVERALQTFATDRFARASGERRALHESLLAASAGLRTALKKLQQLAEAARDSDDSNRFSSWRDWLAGIDLVFAEADTAWLEIFAILSETRVERPGLWKKLFRRRERTAE